MERGVWLGEGRAVIGTGEERGRFQDEGAESRPGFSFVFYCLRGCTGSE
jgi:hypothetical protein